MGVDRVSALAPHIGITETPNTPPTPPPPADPVYGKSAPVRRITVSDVEGWILSVASRVEGRLYRLPLIPVSHPALAGILVSAADAVTNGAAAYLVDTAFPSKASPNDQTSYGEVLWSRYESLLDDLEKRVARAIDDALPGGELGPGLSLGGGFPPPRFKETDRY